MKITVGDIVKIEAEIVKIDEETVDLLIGKNVLSIPKFRFEQNISEYVEYF